MKKQIIKPKKDAKINIIETEQDTKILKINYFKRRSRTIKEKIREWYLKKYKAHDILMINMELTSGQIRTFLVTEKKDGFKYKQGKYLFDPELKYYNIDFGYWAYDFHEKISLPIKKHFPVNTIKTTLETSTITEVEYAINPQTLERFETSKIAEGIMKGQQLDDFMKKVLVLLIIIAVITLIHALMFFQKSGVFAQIQLPF